MSEKQEKHFPAEDLSIWTPSGNVHGLSEVIAERVPPMLYTIAVILIILWLLGLVTSYTMGGFIHILLVIAIVVILLRIISGRNPI
ncbi:MAG: lmo0937 family membrane protein [Leptospirales bacterium]